MITTRELQQLLAEIASRLGVRARAVRLNVSLEIARIACRRSLRRRPRPDHDGTDTATGRRQSHQLAAKL
jgi:hypothetical protein